MAAWVGSQVCKGSNACSLCGLSIKGSEEVEARRLYKLKERIRLNGHLHLGDHKEKVLESRCEIQFVEAQVCLTDCSQLN